MDISGGIQASLAGRYASALFSLARDEKQLAEVETSVATLRAALGESEDFAALTKSQTISRAAAEKIVAALAETLKLDKMTGNLLGVLATNRRLGQLYPILVAFDQLVAAHRGEVTAEVTSAFPLSEAQVDEIRKQLKDRAGRSIKITAKVDPSILGGLIVRMGSQMIDSSIKTRLNTLSQAMKG
ncbi:ATP synthase F1 subcomplex delta subunit [Blastomonas natatoria]|uniref:ATP synthase subunit delta n=1 Tax=Blastomonas natatoria TaxID=34015 RepID=A0A2V3UQI6_9SPHN|nr:F0F1 ATP synthase subunit delta [Blastomonas natatoria]PXW68436.1 ATP synthase F1 subcomplex delta subunit [Blastomonas natatoria]